MGRGGAGRRLRKWRKWEGARWKEPNGGEGANATREWKEGDGEGDKKKKKEKKGKGKSQSAARESVGMGPVTMKATRRGGIAECERVGEAERWGLEERAAAGRLRESVEV